MQCVLFGVWLLSLNIKLVRVTHVLSMVVDHWYALSCIEFHSVTRPPFMHPFCHWWTLNCFLFLAIIQNTIMYVQTFKVVNKMSIWTVTSSVNNENFYFFSPLFQTLYLLFLFFFLPDFKSLHCFTIRYNAVGNSLAVQWLVFCAFTAEGVGSIPGWGTKVLQAKWPKKQNNQKIMFV